MRKNILLKRILCFLAAGGICSGVVLPAVHANDVEYKDDRNISSNVYGGQGKDDADISNNSVTLDNSAVTWGYSVYGGYAEQNSVVSGNSVSIINSSKFSKGNVYGGQGEHNSTVSDNKVSVDNSNVNGNVYGGDGAGYIGFGCTVNGNSVSVTNGSYIVDYVYGGYSGANANVKNNSVVIDDSSVDGYVYGGFGEEGVFGEISDISNNIVNINNNASIKYGIYGGYGKDDCNVNGNQVVLNDSVVRFGWIEGGCALNNSSVTNNSVIVNNLSVKEIDEELIYGGHGENNSIINNNSVVINNSLLEGTDDSSASGKIYGGYGEDGSTANDNSVVINNSSVSAVIIGGKGETAADGNSVEINDSSITGEVYANYSDHETQNGSVVLKGSSDVSGASLYGANSWGSNNNLTVDGWSGTVNSIGKFNNITFKNIQWQDGKTVMTVADGANSDTANTNVNLDSDSGIYFSAGEPMPGQSMTLIKGVDLSHYSKDYAATRGVTEIIDGKMLGTSGGLDLTISAVRANPQLNLIAENRNVSAAFVNQGGDLISEGLDSLSDQYGYGFKTFAAVYGNRSSYDTNSDLKINGWSEIIGFGRTNETDMGDFDWAVFYENGVGNYRTYNSFNNEFFRGDGDLLYNGGGIAARLRRDGGLYYEGSLRAGLLKSEMDNAVKDGAGNFYGYDSDSAYYGAHLGIGRIFDIDEDKELDVYGRFFHTHIDGDSFDIAGERFEFDSVTSDRLRIGAQLRTNKNNKWSAVYGLAYEYEFSGDSDMKAGRFDMPTESLKGGTVIGRIGLSYKADESSPWDIDFNLTGYQGQRDGFSGSALATYNF